MNLIPLDQVCQILQPGFVLPWGIRDANGKLLLAKDHQITDETMLSALLQRGAFVDAVEVARSANRDNSADDKPLGLASRWVNLEAKLGTLLRASTEPLFLQRVRESAQNISALAECNTDLLIYLILRHDYTRLGNYGVAHSLHCAALCSLLARRLGWAESQRDSLLGAALTMNITMLDLQGSLAARGTPPHPSERIEINGHPAAAGQRLHEAGLTDEDWITAVEQHHEVPGGGGYPGGVHAPSEMSQLLRFVDSFAAKHSPRVSRKPQPAQQAARDLFTQSGGSPLAGLLIKELGIYPPGCYVKLASGETAIVTLRGAAANAPIVAAITNRNGDALAQPIRRDTSSAGHAIVSAVTEHSVKVRFAVDKLYE